MASIRAPTRLSAPRPRVCERASSGVLGGPDQRQQGLHGPQVELGVHRRVRVRSQVGDGLAASSRVARRSGEVLVVRDLTLHSDGTLYQRGHVHNRRRPD